MCPWLACVCRAPGSPAACLGVWVLVCRGVCVVPRVHALGHPKRSAPRGSPAEPARTPAPCAPDLHTMNEVWFLGCLCGPLAGLGLSGLRPLPPPWPPHTSEAGLEARSMLSPAKRGKIIKRRTVNSFPTGLGLCADPATVTPPRTRPPKQALELQGSQAECPSYQGLCPYRGRRSGEGWDWQSNPKGGPSLPYFHLGLSPSPSP